MYSRSSFNAKILSLKVSFTVKVTQAVRLTEVYLKTEHSSQKYGKKLKIQVKNIEIRIIWRWKQH